MSVSIIIPPCIDIINSNDTGVKAQGPKGEKGDAFSIDKQYSTAEEMVADTENVRDSQMAVVTDSRKLYIRLNNYTDGEYGFSKYGGTGGSTRMFRLKFAASGSQTSITLQHSSDHGSTWSDESSGYDGMYIVTRIVCA